jgi:chaperonin GroEL
VTKDGVTVAKEIELTDPVEAIGAQFVRDVSVKTGEEAGDGTTTATILAHEMIRIGSMMQGELGSKFYPFDFKEGMNAAKNEVLSLIRMSAKPAKDYLKSIALVSSNNDEEVTSLIMQAVEKVGLATGLITVQNASSTESSLKTVMGTPVDAGYSSPYFCTDPEKMEVVFENPYLFIMDEKCTSFNDLVPILEFALREHRPIVIVTETASQETMQQAIINKLKGLPICIMKAPGYGQMKTDLLEDLCSLTGATLFSQKTGTDSYDPAFCGECRKITITKNEAIVISKEEDETIQATLSKRVSFLQTQVDSCEDDYDREKMQERLAKLTGGLAVIYVGGGSEIEIKEKKDRVDDALCAVKAAMQEGVVPGGGIMFFREGYLHLMEERPNTSYYCGYKCVMESLMAPLRWMLRNAGYGEDSGVLNGFDFNPRSEEFMEKVLNIRTMKIENSYENGILDPYKVLRVCLENSVSIASTVLTTEAVIYDIPEEKHGCSCGCNQPMM